MKKGASRFEFYFAKIQMLLDKAATQKNPGLWLYQNNFRTPLFMLESLAKMYSGIHNTKKFVKVKEYFKVLEDVLGAIDYYDAFAKSFALDKKIPAPVITYLQAQTREKIQSLNELLAENKWFVKEGGRIDKIKKKLNKADWLNEKEEVKAIHEFYGNAIYEIVAFVKESKFQFTNVENGVHELRRKLRWLSIYPQALQGTIQLSATKKSPKHLSKYLTKEIITSPFNIMPDAGDNKHFLLLSKNYFYALSWMIAELGRLKDSGLAVIAVKEALQQTGTITEAAAFKQAYKMLGSKQPTLQQILTNAGGITKTYITENNLEHLVIGTAAAK